MINSTVSDCTLVNLPTETGKCEILTSVENGKTIPFHTKRVYYLYQVPSDACRGAHAHKALRQLIVAACGSFDLILDDAKEQKKISLNCANKGVLIVPGIWREIVNFSPDAVCLVLASEFYDEADYIRDYHQYVKIKS